MSTFESLGVPPVLARSLKAQRILAPFPIQVAAVPPALNGADLCGRAPTGSGKTIAFAIPLAAGCSAAEPRRPTGLVLVPTRELAEQVAAEVKLLANAVGLITMAAYGGVPLDRHIRQLERGVDILVACPGRLRDLIDRGHIALGSVEIAVVDEADRLADMGFLPEVRRLMDETPESRQTLLFSATLDGEVAALIERYQRDPVMVSVDEAKGAKPSIRHVFWKVPRDQRLDILADTIGRLDSVVVFCRTRHGSDRVAQQLGRRGISTAVLHGDKSQKQRDRAIELFKSGAVQVLVATDVASRGIHVDDVSAVVQFDIPADDKDYVHRAGRTARAGREGVVITLVIPEAERGARQLIGALGIKVELVRADPARLGAPSGFAPAALPPSKGPQPASNRSTRKPRPQAKRQPGRSPGTPERHRKTRTGTAKTQQPSRPKGQRRGAR